MADLKIHANDWSGLSKDEQEKISAIMKNTGLLEHGANIVGDPSVKSLTAGVALSSPFCKIACDVAEAAAVAACGLLSGPAVPICIAAAHAGGELCRSKC